MPFHMAPVATCASAEEMSFLGSSGNANACLQSVKSSHIWYCRICGPLWKHCIIASLGLFYSRSRYCLLCIFIMPFELLIRSWYSHLPSQWVPGCYLLKDWTVQISFLNIKLKCTLHLLFFRCQALGLSPVCRANLCFNGIEVLSEPWPWPHPSSFGDVALVDDTEFARIVTILEEGGRKETGI